MRGLNVHVSSLRPVCQTLPSLHQILTRAVSYVRLTHQPLDEPNTFDCLTCPYTYNAVPPAFDQITIFYTHMLHDAGILALLGDACAAAPLSAFNFIVHLDHVFPRGAHYSPSIEHHARDGVVVCVGVEDGACTEIPYLKGCEQA